MSQTMCGRAVKRPAPISRKERRHKSQKWQKVNQVEPGDLANDGQEPEAVARKMLVNESQLFSFMHQVNEIYLEFLKQPPPFARYILLGLQSTGKSTVVERLLTFPMNIVAEGTGTRCPLYVTCIHEPSVAEAECELTGCERCAMKGAQMKLEQVFERVTVHNKEHVDGFTSEALRLRVKSKNVQNMFFVDLPGIITTKGRGQDNRDAIKKILKEEARVENTKLLVLLEPKEFATNSIVDFIDETLGTDRKWLNQALFLMTKFDLRIGDSLTGSKSNRFLDEYWHNKIQPFMVITPTMQRSADTMTADEQYRARQELLRSSADYEHAGFSSWQQIMSSEYQKDPRSEELGAKFLPYLGFKSAVHQMNRLLLDDTRKRLPQVLRELSSKRDEAVEELQVVQQMVQFSDESKLRVKMAEILQELIQRISSYLDGSMKVANKLPHMHQTLHEEIDEEEDSPWARRPLNHLDAVEEDWREHIASMAERDVWPSSVQEDGKFLGGKQYQRALGFFRAVMIDRLPDPHALKPNVVTATGALRGGLNHEDWEHACVEIIKDSLRTVSEAGINFFVKHALYIFRRLLTVAFEDAKEGEPCSMMFKHLPEHLRRWAFQRYDEMLWKIGTDAVANCHQSMEPYYSTVNPSIPTLNNRRVDSPLLKAGWGQFAELLRQRKIEKLYHFTDKRNMTLIEQLGGLYSWKSLQSMGHKVPAPGGNDDSHSVDAMHELDGFVHCSFCEYHPLLSEAQNDGRLGDCVILAIDPVVVTWSDTTFSNMNTSDIDAQIGPALSDLKSVDFEAVAMNVKEAPPLADCKGRMHQAEVLVKGHIPKQFITVVREVPKNAGVKSKMKERVGKIAGGVAPKAFMQIESDNQATQRVEFLPSARAQMMCPDEVDVLLDRSYDYIKGLFKFIMIHLEFQFNHYLFVEFKRKLVQGMGFELIASTDWKALAKPDTGLADRMRNLEKQVAALDEALANVSSIAASAP